MRKVGVPQQLSTAAAALTRPQELSRQISLATNKKAAAGAALTRPQDVGQHDKAAIRLQDEPHGHARNHALQRHACGTAG